MPELEGGSKEKGWVGKTMPEPHVSELDEKENGGSL